MSGCVERLLNVKSDPPGAQVFLDGELKGVTPIEIPYTFYGGRDVTLEMPGYASITKRVNLRPPWWQVFPLDFITDLLVPLTLTDREELSVMMQKEPGEKADIEGLKNRADELRKKTK
jgi:hypothetical protein